VQRGDDWARTAHVTNAATGSRTGFARTSGGDVYADRNGNVYRKQDGSWQKYDNGGWQPVQRPNNAAGNLSGQTRQGLRPTNPINPANPSNPTGNPAGNLGNRNIGGQTRQGLQPTGNQLASPTMNQLNRDWNSRMEGAQRMQTNQRFQNSNASGFGNRQFGGSFRPSGGFGGGRSGGGGFGGRRR
jgi:hypothetical protein